jgi:single-stranded-DNA-specific exonuclease
MLSVLRKKWIPQTADELKVMEICQKHQVSDLVARILASRGIGDITNFLNPKIRNLLPNPFTLIDMERAVERTVHAIKNNEKITIYGDYDVDGATSVSLLILYLRNIGITADYYIPDRISEGYGVNQNAIESIKNNGTHLLIMVDCGTTSIEEIKLARGNKMACIVLDHHAVGAALPQAVIVNPHRADQPAVPSISDLCAAGVTFLFLVGLQVRLREAGFFARTKPLDLMAFLDLVALGTVCDVMPLLGLNRAFVRRGLELIQKRGNMGVSALIDTAGVNTKISSYHLGFALGPRINAGGRIGSSTLGTRLLTTPSKEEAVRIAEELNQLNAERQFIEKLSISEAIAQIETRNLQKNSVILTGHNKWHLGVIGIMASRLKERYNKPVFVYSLEGDYAKGSCRSVEGVNIGEIVHKAVKEGVLASGGGHAMAAGFSFYKDKEAALQSFLNANTAEFMASYCPIVKIDAEISIAGMTMELVDSLEQLEPIGVGNPSPIFCVRNVRVASLNVVNGGHIQCRLVDEAGNSVPAIAFKSDGTPLGRALTFGVMDVVGALKKRTWKRSETLQFVIEDVTSFQ